MNLWVKVNVGCVPEGLNLFLKRLIDFGMAVPHRHSDNASKHVQVLIALLIIQVLHLAGVDQKRLPVVGKHGWAEVLLPDISNCFIAWALIAGYLSDL